MWGPAHRATHAAIHAKSGLAKDRGSPSSWPRNSRSLRRSAKTWGSEDAYGVCIMHRMSAMARAERAPWQAERPTTQRRTQSCVALPVPLTWLAGPYGTNHQRPRWLDFCKQHAENRSGGTDSLRTGHGQGRRTHRTRQITIAADCKAARMPLGVQSQRPSDVGMKVEKSSRLTSAGPARCIGSKRLAVDGVPWYGSHLTFCH